MRFFGLRLPRLSQRFLCPGLIALATACSVYDGDSPFDRADGGGSAGSGGTGGAASNGGAAGTGAAGSGGTTGSDGAADGVTSDATRTDADASLTDVVPRPPDALDAAGASDALETGWPGDDGGAIDTLPPPDADTADASDTSTTDTSDVVAPPIDVSSDPPVGPDADAKAPQDADSGPRDASDGAPTGPQILPQHGSPIAKPDAGGPFDSRCASDEVVTGFVGRAGVQTDAIASTCSKLISGVLSAPHNLPLNGFPTGGNAFTVVCPANYVAVGVVGRYGHNTMWMEDVTTMIGVVCKDLASSTTQTVTITGQPALDSGYTSFREDCTGGRYLTDISGRIDSNSLGVTVGQVGGECNVR